MADLCVVYLSEDEQIVTRLIELLRRDWTVWSALDVSHGDWQRAVLSQIEACRAVVPVFSAHSKTDRTMILRDEIRFAVKRSKPVLPFVIAPSEMPLGLGDLNRTEAFGWVGDWENSAFQLLRRKIESALQSINTQSDKISRPRTMPIGTKGLEIPAFVFSLSSHETQVTPLDGSILLHQLQPAAILVSAYDAWIQRSPKQDGRRFRANIRRLRDSETLLFLDSGNYEAYRKKDRHSKANPTGWRAAHFRETARYLSPDIVFSFDSIPRRGSAKQIASQVAKRFHQDQNALAEKEFPICPIVHLPPQPVPSSAELAAEALSLVAMELDPIMLAIPERELGVGLMAKAKAVRQIRGALNSLGTYYPLHLLGTGNPLSMVVLAAAGADAFDGLEWCRTVADYATGHLFHFQQLDCFLETCLPRVQDLRTRLLLEDPSVPYAMKALVYNVDFFNDWSRTMRDMLHSGQAETLLRCVPNIGPQLFRALDT